MRSLIGAQNPAQNVFSLRKCGWEIKTGFIRTIDRDGKKCRSGYYWLESSEKERAYEFLQKTERAAQTAQSANDNLEHDNSHKLNPSNNTKGGKNDNPLS